jgi:GxxExxY protein
MENNIVQTGELLLNRGERKGGAGSARKNYSTDRYEDVIATAVKNAALQVHRSLGPGLLESAYEECLAYTLSKDGWGIKRQHPMPLIYEEVKMEIGYRLDLMIEDKVIVEIKSVEKLNDVHMAQVLTYLKLSGCKLGLLINFNNARVMDGFHRIVNKL